MLVDESGFYPLAATVSTWALIGQAPILFKWQTHDHLSAITGIPPAFFSCANPINGELAARFLTPLQRNDRPRLSVVGDETPVHRNHAVKTVLEQTQSRV